MLLHNRPFLFFIFFYVFTCCSCLGLSLCNSFILSSYCVCELSFFSFHCLFAYIKSLSYISHHFSPLFIHLSSHLTKVTLSFCTVITCVLSFTFLFSFGQWVGPCTPTPEGSSICACRYGSVECCRWAAWLAWYPLSSQLLSGYYYTSSGAHYCA